MLRPIADTTIFDLRLARRGRRLNKLCAALCSPQEREAFKRDEEAFMSRFGLSDAEKELIRKRDF
jgi:protocatechuate 4,5-dioxygenase, alpha chain